ncbi:MAG: phosphoenolpyruvate--protein phosphotransferase [Spirochaetales bacterium]|nr:phosphoenolpyruvate--protein phosphotransferase [Spirochaetales bacterium]
MTDSFILTGIAASPGTAIAPVLILRELELNLDSGGGHELATQLRRFAEARNIVREQIMKLREEASAQHEEWTIKIFDSHLYLASDPELLGSVENRINENGVRAEYALLLSRDEFALLLENSGSEMMVERAGDLRDVTNRLIAVLTGQKQEDLSELSGEVILAAHELSPLETAQLDTKFVKGIITETGGYSCHTAIMARSRGIPAVTGSRGILGLLESGLQVILDGDEGWVRGRPGEAELKTAREKLAEQLLMKEHLKAFRDKKTQSLDGTSVNIGSHLGRLSELDDALRFGAEGIGLFRTEFLFMESSGFPNEDVQFEAYREVLERMNPRPVIIRTMDIGGDKTLSYIDLPAEDNPFLGVRGIRYSLRNPEIFRVQLRALLRASAYGNLKIMFPMVSVPEELKEARNIVDDEAEKLRLGGVHISQDVEIGVMIEVPSAALLADELAEHVDFFSIGTNDLIQYTMAADRMNDEVAHLYQPLNPAVLRLIQMVTDASRKHGLWTGVCGEMAGDPEALPLLLGLGVRELSVGAPQIPAVRELISRLNLKNNNLKG